MYTPQTNQNITLETINLIDLKGNVFPSLSTRQVVSSFDHTNYILVLVSPTTATARLFTIATYRRHVYKIRQALQESQKDIQAKELPLTWNIGEGDLAYRLKRCQEYLSEGRRVNIIIGARKAKLTRDYTQRHALVKQIKDALAPFGKEWRDMTGGFPSVELWFEGIKTRECRTITESDIETAGGVATQQAEQTTTEQTEESEKSLDKSVEDVVADETIRDAPPNKRNDKTLSHEDLLASRTNLLDKGKRRALRAAANAAYLAANPAPKPEKASPEKFWESLARVSQPKPESVEEPKTTELEQPSEEVLAAIRDEFILPEEKRRMQVETERKLRSVANQFSKLGRGSSILGGLGLKKPT
jgi:translation initiation factor IF-3